MPLKAILPARDCDDYGCGYFGAPRGSREHEGRDVACYPGTIILPFEGGKVTKLGHPYSDNPRTEYNELNYKYVEITTPGGERRWRYFYIEPEVELNEEVYAYNPIGKVQDLRIVYGDTDKKNAIINHVHVELFLNGERVDPLPFMI